MIFLLNEPLNLLLVWVLGFYSVKIIDTDMIEIVMKIKCRNAITHIIFADP